MKYIGKNILNHTLNVKKGNISGSSTSTGSFGDVFASQLIGVGNSSPGAQLHLYRNDTSTLGPNASTSTRGLLIEQAGTGDAVMSFLTTGQTAFIIGIDNDDSDAFKITQGQNNLGSGTTHFRYGRTGRLTLEGTDARLGVATDDPGLQLTVEGYGQLSNRLRVGKNAGTVPDAMLDVHGDAIITGSLTTEGNVSGSATSTGSFGKLRLSDSLEVNTTPSATAVIHSGGDNGAGTGNTLKIQTGTKNLSYASYIELEPNSSGNIVINPRADELELYGRLNFYETYDISTSGFNDLSLTTRDGSTPWTGYGDSAQIIVGTNTNAGINLYTHGTGLVYISGSSAGDKLEVVGGIKATGNISGSSTSTGSFGRVEADVFSGSFHGQIGARYIHTQSTPSTTWTINHALGTQYPNVTVYDSNDQMVIPTTVTANGGSNMTLTFSAPVAGVAMVGIGGGSSVNGRTFMFNQDTTSTLWQVTHSLGEQYPAVTIYDEADNVIIPQRIYAKNTSEAEIYFQDPTSGNAHFSIGNGLPGINSDNAGNFMRVSSGGTHIEYTTSTADVTGSFAISGSITLTGEGSVSGSATSTGSFGAVTIGTGAKNSIYGLTIQNDQTAGIALNDTGQGGPYQIAANGSVLYIRYNDENTRSIFLNNSGNVGIGANSTGAKLEVQGNVSGSATSTGSFGSVHITDKLGVNTTVPVERFHVVGKVRAQDGSSSNDYVETFHDGTDGHLISNRGSLILGSQGSANAITIDSNADVILKAGKKLFFDGSNNTYIFESSDGVIDIFGDNVHLASFKQNGTQSEVVINEGSGDVDFRVESNNSQHAFFVEAEDAGKVGIGTDSPTRKLHVEGDALVTGILTAQEFHTEFISASVLFDSGSTVFGDSQDDIHHFTGSLRQSGSNQDHYLLTGKVGIGTDSPQTILHIKGEGDKLRVDASDGTQILQIQEFTGQIADIIGPGNKALRINHNSSGDVFIGTGGGSVMLGNTVANPASGFSNQKGFGFNGSTGQVQIASSTNTAAMQIGKNESTDGDLVVFRHESVTVGAIDTDGGISGSAISTGSFGVLGIGGGSTPGTNNIHVYEGGAKNARISIEANNVSYNPSLNLRNNNADGQIELDYRASNRGDMNFYLDNDIGGALGAIMSLRKEGHVEFIGANQKISGSSTSTGSFGMVTAGVSTAQAGGIFHVQGVGAGQALGIIEDTVGNANFLIKATASNKNSLLLFGDGASDEIGRIDYDHNDNSLDFVVNNGTAVTINSSQQTTFNGNIRLGDSIAIDLGSGIDSQIFQTGAHLFFRNNLTDSDFIFQVNDGGSTQTEVMRIDASTSRVGIGTAVPSQKLHVSSSGTAALIEGVTNGNAPALHVIDKADTFVALLEGNRAGDTGAAVCIYHNPATSQETNRTRLNFQMNDDGDARTTYAQLASFIDDHTDGTEDGHLKINTMTGGSVTEHLHIGNQKVSGSSTSTGSFGAGFFGGNVGVGIDPEMTGFDRVLHVGGTSTAVTRFTGTTYSNDGGWVGLNYGGIELWQERNAYMRFGTNNTERVRITGDGFVGIGTASPTHFLEVSASDSGDPVVDIYNTHATNGYGLRVSAGDDANVYSARFQDVSLNPLMTVWGGGNVSIGPQDSIHTLSVYNDGAATDVSIGKYATGKTAGVLFTSADTSGYFGIQSYASQGSSFGDIILNSQGGQVGIGTTGPSAALHISETNDGGDTAIILNNNAGVGSTDETVSLFFTHAGIAGGKIVSGRTFNYSTVANRDSNLQFFTTQNATDTLALTLDADQTTIFAGNASGSLVSTGSFGQLQIGHTPTHGQSDADMAHTVSIANHTDNTSGAFLFISAQQTADGNLGHIDFCNNANTDSDKRIAEISSRRVDENNSGQLDFTTKNAGSFVSAFRMAKNGDLTATDTTIGSISDERTKQNIQTYSGSLSMVNTLRPVTFEWKSNRKKSGTQRGFVAQEITSSDAYWVRTEKVNENQEDYEYLGDVTGSREALVSKLTEKDTMYVSAIQELTQAVRDLRAMITGSTDLNQLKTQVSSSSFV